METLVDYLKTHKSKGFRPKPHYSVEGDSLTFYFGDDESYGERVDDFLTVYKAVATDELVGCQVKGLAKALELLGDFKLVIEDKSVLLGTIFIACMAVHPPLEPELNKRYRQLGQMTGDVAIPVKELESVPA